MGSDNVDAVGGSGADRLWDEEGDDGIDGGDQGDMLLGGAGNDFLKGGNGDDTVILQYRDEGQEVGMSFGGSNIILAGTICDIPLGASFRCFVSRFFDAVGAGTEPALIDADELFRSAMTVGRSCQPGT
jgi:Ca2+-binding RTX toxin-like protein